MTFKKILLACSLSVLLAACDEDDKNKAPTASGVAISGDKAVGQTLTGKYTYKDEDDDKEGASKFSWLRNGEAIAGATKATYVITADDLDKTITFVVTPVALTGEPTGSKVESSPVKIPPKNRAPTATNVRITGTPLVGNTLTGMYDYEDADGDDEGTSTFRWLRDGAPIADATGKTYVAVTDDEDKKITFAVTPVALAGESTGSEKKSLEITIQKTGIPLATEVRITGEPSLGNELTGVYTYIKNGSGDEGASTFSWFRNGELISNETEKTYVVTRADIDAKIRFAVTPVADGGGTPVTGEGVKSDPVTVTASTFTLKCNATTEEKFANTGENDYTTNRGDLFIHRQMDDRPWSNKQNNVAADKFSVADIKAEFDAAREMDPTIKEKLRMPTQEVWDSYSSSQKILYLVNSERCDRGLVPFEGIDPRMVTTAQEWADKMTEEDFFSHGKEGTSNYYTARIADSGVNTADGGNADFLAQGENLAFFDKYFPGVDPEIGEPEAQSVYNWMYNDREATRSNPAEPSEYGHRTFITITGLKNNYAAPGNDSGGDTEGLLGGAIKNSAVSDYTHDADGKTYRKRTVKIVMHAFDPSTSYEPKADDKITPAPTFIAPSAADCEDGSTYKSETLTCE
ncbi:MAG: hypothetical protein CSB47_07565 [Proteobacteria bacterium]|nr:MAG: hypothetical protein CSB47_07565 [Pseudomonadota bacterium]